MELTVVANRSKAQPKAYTIRAISQPVARSTDFSIRSAMHSHSSYLRDLREDVRLETMIMSTKTTANAIISSNILYRGTRRR